MKLVTFVASGRERFGFTVTHPATGLLWVFDPEEVEQRLWRYASLPTSAYGASKPRFLDARPWPGELAAFLALGDPGMSALRRMTDFLQRFLEQADQCLLAGAGYPLDRVKLRAPVPHPRIFFGLVENSPTFWRNDPKRTILNISPQGHDRPQGTVIGPGDPVWMPSDAGDFGWNPELGVIIGQGGKNIPVTEALQHVAGLTVVLDILIFDYMRAFREEAGDPRDWFAVAAASWLGKKSDTMCPMGPYLTTLDDIGNIYDLLVYTRQSGWLRDRSHTNSMLIGIERLISWLSSFMTLYPGDVLHMATMGLDSLFSTPDMVFGPGDYLEGEIERVGVLRVPVVREEQGDWRSPDDPGVRIHPSPAVRDVIERGQAAIAAPQDWSLKDTRHFWTTYGNYTAVPQVEHIAVSLLPRVINGPASALGLSGRTVTLPARARALSVGAELAFVVNCLSTRVSEAEAESHILGYLAMVSIMDTSFSETLREPATPQERNIPGVFGRWGDGYNIVSGSPVPLAIAAVRGRTMRLTIDSLGEVLGNTDEYVVLAPRILAFMSRHVTLFPGDVVTLGRTAGRLTIPAGRRLPEGSRVQANVDGIGSVDSVVVDDRILPEGSQT